jgi:hypothetical protein
MTTAIRSLAAVALALFGVIAMVAARTAAIGGHSTPTMPQGILGILVGMTGAFAWSEAFLMARGRSLAVAFVVAVFALPVLALYLLALYLSVTWGLECIRGSVICRNYGHRAACISHTARAAQPDHEVLVRTTG